MKQKEKTKDAAIHTTDELLNSESEWMKNLSRGMVTMEANIDISISSRKTKKNHKNVNFHLSKWARSYYNIEVNGHGESRRVYVCRC